MITYIVLAAAVVMAVSLIGVLFTHQYAKALLEEKLPYLVSFSAGVFLVTAGGMALEVFELVSAWWIGVALIIAGYLAAWGIQALLPEAHHHHDPECKQGHGRSAAKLLVGDSIHNVADGIILVPAFMVSPALGVAVTVSIVIHEALQEISEYFVLRQAGYSARKALLLNLMTASTIFIGVGLALLALATTNLEILLLAFSAGFFLHVVVHDLFPRHAHEEGRSRWGVHALLIALGVLLMVGVGVVLGDAHVHGGAGHDHEHAHEDETHYDHMHEGEAVHDHDHVHDATTTESAVDHDHTTEDAHIHEADHHHE